MKDRNKALFDYKFNNGEKHTMTPPEAHKYAERKNLKIISGPGYVEGQRKETYRGWGYHDTLQKTFKGPRDYRDYLRANGLIECGDLSSPQFTKPKPTYWTDETIKLAIGHGIEIGSVLAEALKKGELDFPEA